MQYFYLLNSIIHSGHSFFQGIHFFSKEEGRVKRLGRGAQEKVSNRVCVYTTQLGFQRFHLAHQSFSNRQPQRGSAPVDEALGCGPGLLGSNPSVPVLTFVPKCFRKVAPPSHPPISIPPPVHTPRSFFSPSEIFPLIPPQNQPQVFPLHPSPQGILSVGTPTHLPLGEKTPTQGKSVKVLQPKERMT